MTTLRWRGNIIFQLSVPLHQNDSKHLLVKSSQQRLLHSLRVRVRTSSFTDWTRTLQWVSTWLKNWRFFIWFEKDLNKNTDHEQPWPNGLTQSLKWFNSATGQADFSACISYDGMTILSVQSEAACIVPFLFLRVDESLLMRCAVICLWSGAPNACNVMRDLVLRPDEKKNTWFCSPLAAQMGDLLLYSLDTHTCTHFNRGGKPGVTHRGQAKVQCLDISKGLATVVIVGT